VIEKQVGAERVACVVIEPIQGEGGFIVPAEGFLPAVADWCRDNGVVFIADEIQTGFARTGAMFACEHEKVVPDLITTAKGIAGGLPLAAVTGRAEIMDSIHGGGLGGTYGGNPVACAAALGAIATIESQHLVEAAQRIESVMLGRLHELAAAHPQLGDVRGRGAMLAVEIVKPGTIEPDAAETSRINAACHAAGLVTLTCGTYGNVLRFLPPLVMPPHLLAEGLDLLAAAIAG
jgi:4-aminobutyrate aminotransferase / (S)-3-amino-2-methylpropionate transaminase / 5-aminovalerate transaminase